ncbi:hypothetical protein LTR86_008735 [Recurvomyces mirabilis]|nr:hypothetical protein LTR86_008735 [Recurvomyces mirabilis]
MTRASLTQHRASFITRFVGSRQLTETRPSAVDKRKQAEHELYEKTSKIRELEAICRDVRKGADLDCAVFEQKCSRIRQEGVAENTKLKKQLDDAVKATQAITTTLKAKHEETSNLRARFDGVLVKLDRAEGILRNNKQKTLQYSSSQRKIEAENKKLQAERDDLSRTLHIVKRQSQDKDTEAEKCRRDLAAYKFSIASSIHSEGQITDGTVKARFDEVFYALQDVAISATRASVFDPAKMSPALHEWLSQHVDTSCILPKRASLNVVTALMAKILVARYLPECCFSVSPSPMIEAAFAFAQNMNPTSSKTNAWVQLTREILQGVDKTALAHSDEEMINGMIEELNTLFVDTLPGAWNMSVEKDLRKLCTDTMQHFMALYSAKPIFSIRFMPVTVQGKHCGYSSETMQSISEDEDDLEGQPLMLSIFPIVFKNGDEFGNPQDQDTVICQARVLPHKTEASLI